MPRALVIDQGEGCDRIVAALRLAGVCAETVASAAAGMVRVTASDLDLDLVVAAPGEAAEACLQLVARAKAADRCLPVVLRLAAGDMGLLVEALRLGVDDALLEPVTTEEAGRILSAALERGRRVRQERREQERVDRHNRVKSRFLANISHELRTPLTTIIGMSEVLAEGTFGTLNSRQRRYVETMEGSAKHLLGLINDILDYSKVEAGKMTLSLGRFTAAEAVATSCSLIGHQAAGRGIRVRTSGDAPVGTLTGDRGKVVQILVNLLSNAIKFSPAASAVRVDCRADDREVRFTVTDRGVGIPSESLDSIFEEFQQVRAGTSGKDAGTGLGLALSRRLARLHGGDIEVSSALGRGSTFTLVLPRRGAGADACAASGPAQEALHAG